MGRKKLPDDISHSRQYRIRLNDEEYRMLKFMADWDNKPISYIIRRAISRDWFQCGYNEHAKRIN